MADAFWVHGNAAQLQLPSDLKSPAVTNGGFTVKVSPAKSGWIHMPLPTPTVVDDIRAELTAIHLNFSIDNPNAYIQQVVVYDGGASVATLPDAPYGGESALTLGLPAAHSVKSGIGLSIEYEFLWDTKEFGKPPTNEFATLTIHSAGADYKYVDLSGLTPKSTGPTIPSGTKAQQS